MMFTVFADDTIKHGIYSFRERKRVVNIFHRNLESGAAVRVLTVGRAAGWPKARRAIGRPGGGWGGMVWWRVGPGGGRPSRFP